MDIFTILNYCSLYSRFVDICSMQPSKDSDSINFYHVKSEVSFGVYNITCTIKMCIHIHPFPPAPKSLWFHMHMPKGCLFHFWRHVLSCSSNSHQLILHLEVEHMGRKMKVWRKLLYCSLILGMVNHMQWFEDCQNVWRKGFRHCA